MRDKGAGIPTHITLLLQASNRELKPLCVVLTFRSQRPTCVKDYKVMKKNVA